MEVFMKKLIYALLLSGTVLSSNSLFTTMVFANTPTTQSTVKANEYNNSYTSIFNTMKMEMNNVVSSGNVNLDFVTQMPPHHKGAINMSKAILQYGSNPEVKKMAEHIITSQEAELPVLQNMQEKFKQEAFSGKEASAMYNKKYNEIKGAMFKNMESVPLTPNADLNFLKQMIFHHQGAIDMSKNILEYTKDPELIKLAINTIKSQSKDIKEMQKLINTLQ